MTAGRPRKYATKEERKLALAAQARARYAKAKNRPIRDYDRDTKDERFRGTKAYRLYYGAKVRASKLGLPFDMTCAYIQDLLDSSPECPLLNVPFDEDVHHLRASLDKIIPELGYVEGNVQILSYRANTIKNNASFEEFERVYLNWKASLDL